jgi:hypothetical protein
MVLPFQRCTTYELLILAGHWLVPNDLQQVAPAILKASAASNDTG